jgi:hypothetical protein
MAIASAMNLVNALRMDGDESFVGRSAFGRVLAVLVPALLYVAAIGGIEIGPLKVHGLGLYVASALFLAGFMIVIGREAIWKALLVAGVVPVFAFVLFERWFKVALPKGPLEAWLGLA